MHILGHHQASINDDPILLDQTSRFQHTYAIGQTGTGKSTFLKQSFLQDVHQGHGACYFDFHGKDAPWLLDHIPPERLDDVIYFDPLHPSHVLGYNVLDGVRPADYSGFTDEIVASLRHIHSASWGARMDDILINAIRPLFDLPAESQGTLMGAVRMLNDPQYRTWVINQTTEKTVQVFWRDEFAKWGKTDQAHNVNSSLNKIRRFQSAPLLRHTLGQQRSSINFARAIQSGQIVILNIDKWKMGTVNASTLAALILSRLIYEGTHRPLPDVPEGALAAIVKPFHIFIDEFHSISTTSTIEALSGIRKFNIGLTLSHQYADQLDKHVLDAIIGNVGTKIAFRIGGTDAARLAASFDVSDPSQLTEQADYHFIANHKSGNVVRSSRGKLYPPAFKNYGYGMSIMRQMQAKFAHPIIEIDAQYDRWQQSRHYGTPRTEVTVRKKEGRGVKDAPTRHGARTSGMKSISAIMLN